ncbi:MAG: hypothetical protein WD356_09660, partial [Pseudomonadales bacterium]
CWLIRPAVTASRCATSAPFRDQRSEVIEPALYPQFRVGVDGGDGQIDVERDGARLSLDVYAGTAVSGWTMGWRLML